MADIENKYYQVDGDIDSQPVASGRWSKLSIALFCGLGLASLSILAQYASRPTRAMNSTAESINLLGSSAHLRPSSAARKPHIINAMGQSALPGSGPFKKIALAAIEAHNSGKRMRDVLMMANMDDKVTKAAAAEVEAEVGKAGKLKAKDLPGITAPLGFWDPAGFSADIPEGKLLFYREAELKHGRVCMLATLGMFVGEEFHPLSGGNIDSFAATLGPYQSLALTQTPLKVLWFVILLFSAAGEAIGLRSLNMGAEFGTLTEGSTPGDFGFDPLGLKKGFVEKGNWDEIQTKELNNGRLAMIAAAGIIGQELATGQKIF